ncbi:unnamed protein product [Prorocentrum cordatum]|uniref:Dihydroorotase n=1 Tax=Prorocentrum cordatum TaxID=2364126 RepID=A0ABN9WE17_9DINO|nr:unnamed protein product [Polarella glacialis]
MGRLRTSARAPCRRTRSGTLSGSGVAVPPGQPVGCGLRGARAPRGEQSEFGADHALIFTEATRIVAGLMPSDGRQCVAQFVATLGALLSEYDPAQLDENEAEPPQDSGYVHAVKLYPAGATTNSDFGVTDYGKIMPALRKMEELGLLLLVHGESTDQSVDVFEREQHFYGHTMPTIIAQCPKLRVVCEHITSAIGAEFVESQGPNVAATITAHHLMYNRNAIFKGGINPHFYCLPILKTEPDRRKLLECAIKSPKFFLGTDSAPHAVDRKESAAQAARAASRLTWRLSSWPRPSSPRGDSRPSRTSSRKGEQLSTGCRLQRAPGSWRGRPGRSPTGTLSGTGRSSRSARASRSTGSCAPAPTRECCAAPVREQVALQGSCHRTLLGLWSSVTSWFPWLSRAGGPLHGGGADNA